MKIEDTITLLRNIVGLKTGYFPFNEDKQLLLPEYQCKIIPLVFLLELN